jgi:hypothetical protein
MTPSMSNDSRRLISALPCALLFAVALQACAAIPLAALAGPALSTGGEAVVKAGTAYAANGTAYRTFPLPIADVHAAVLEALQRIDVGVKRDETSKKGEIDLDGATEHRKIRVRLTSLTGTLTAMKLVVKRNILASDKATASELLAQVEQVLAEKAKLVTRADVTAVLATNVIRAPAAVRGAA